MIPETTEELIEYLSQQYPPRCIRKEESLESAHRYAGAVDLIEWMKFKLEEADRDRLKVKLKG